MSDEEIGLSVRATRFGELRRGIEASRRKRDRNAARLEAILTEAAAIEAEIESQESQLREGEAMLSEVGNELHRLNGRAKVRAIERLRDAVWWVQQKGSPASMEAAMTLAFTLAAKSFERAHNAGVQFPRREGGLPPGPRKRGKAAA